MKKKKLSFVSIILLTINAIIGTGIFLSPGSVTMLAGDKAPLIYLVAAVLAIVLAVSFASAAKYVKDSGAAYAYAKAAFGDKRKLDALIDDIFYNYNNKPGSGD